MAAGVPGVIGFSLLVFLPGAWISFGLPLKEFTFLTKILLGMVFSPIVVALQFYLLRSVGVSVGLSILLLVVLNIPTAYLVARQRFSFSPPGSRVMGAIVMVAVVILASVAPFLLDPQKRLYTWEAWMHADIIYSLADGNLLLEDPELAGVTLSYPWVGHVYQAALSYLIGTSPVTNYIWLNLIWLAIIFTFVGGIVAELGGAAFSSITVASCLAFGVNFIGYVLGRTIPQSWSDSYHILRYIEGDNRYTPWLDKVLIFGQMYFGLGLFTAIVFVVIKRWPCGYTGYYLLVVGLLVCGLGLVYPVLLPAAYVVLGARAVLLYLRRRGRWSTEASHQLLGLSGIVLLAGVLALAQVRFLTEGRTGAPLVTLNSLKFMGHESVTTVVVMSPLLVGLMLSFLRCWKSNRDGLIILGSGGVFSCALYVLFDIPWWRNEYKFIFTAAICFAPFASLALEPVLDRLGRFGLLAFALLTVLLAIPFAWKVYQEPYDWYTRPGPLMDTSHFDLRLTGGAPLSDLIHAVRERTPAGSILVLQDTTLHYPTLAHRQLYVAPAEASPQPGILVTSDEMLTLVKGYPRETVEQRRSTVRTLFESNDPVEMEASLRKVLVLGRPLVLILDETRQVALAEWLHQEGIGEMQYRGNGLVVWLINSSL